jgi:hypothetical protein
MSLITPENLREPWSRITDTGILHPRDELRLVGVGFTAIIGVLDSHDPSATTPFSWGELLGIESPPLSDHHHILVQVEGQPDILSAGLFVGVGEPEDLLMDHVTRQQSGDEDYCTRIVQLYELMTSDDNHGLYYISDQEPLSATPAGQVYLDTSGGLLR